MRRFLIPFAVVLTLSCCTTQVKYPQVAAHRGCHLGTLVPENSLWGVEMAQRFGYPSVEIDVKYTLDSVMVIMHDGTINRTMRNASDYSVIEQPVRVSETTFEELRSKYVLASDDPAHREPIPTLEEILRQCMDYGIHPILHSHLDSSYVVAQAMLGDEWTCFTSNFDNVIFARSISNCDVLYDPDRLPADETAAKLAPCGGNLGMSTMKYDMLDGAYIAKMHEAGMVCQSSIFPSPHEADAILDGADIILSDFCWLQGESSNPLLSWKERKLKLNPDNDFLYRWNQELEFGAVTVELEVVSGKAVLTVNDTYVYEIPREGRGNKVVLGFRGHEFVPSVTIEVPEGECVIKGLSVKCYDL